jgi:hypothetical protein
MTRLDLDPDLERLGDALRASATTDLAREEPAARSASAGHGRDAAGARTRPKRARPRVLAGSSLGLVGVGAALLLALSGTAATPPAYAITQKSDGTVFVKINFWGHKTLMAADTKLIARFHETALIQTAPGPATVPGPVTCTPTADPYASGATPSGPQVKILLGTDGTGVIPAGDTGAGSVHLTGCATYVSYPHSNTGAGSSGNSGS